MLIQCPLTGTAGYFRQLFAVQLQCSDRVGCTVCQQDLFARLEEIFQSGPAIAEQRCAASSRFEQTTGRTPTHLRHRRTSDVESQARRSEERGVLRGWQVPDEVDVGRPWKVGRILRAAVQETEVVPRTGRLHE